MKQARRTFPPEFKQETVRQITERSRPVSQVARDLDLRPEQLRIWLTQLQASGLVAAAYRTETVEEENSRLRREVAAARL